MNMNLLECDAILARTVLSPWGVSARDINVEWYEGSMSLVVKHLSIPIPKGSESVEAWVRYMINSFTTISIPIVVIDNSDRVVIVKKGRDFKFNFKVS